VGGKPYDENETLVFRHQKEGKKEVTGSGGTRRAGKLWKKEKKKKFLMAARAGGGGKLKLGGPRIHQWRDGKRVRGSSTQPKKAYRREY